MKPQVYHVDAFTSQPFRGNSAGVVFPADNLSEAQMQLIARELGHSETAFLLHSDDSDGRYSARLANSGGNDRTLKSDDSTEAGSGYRRPFA